MSCAISGCSEGVHVIIRYGSTVEPRSTHTDALCREHSMELWDKIRGRVTLGTSHWTNFPVDHPGEVEEAAV